MKMATSVEISKKLVNLFHRDLIGPRLDDQDLANERLNESPSRWYLTGFLAPAEDSLSLNGSEGDDDPSAQEEMEIEVEEVDTDGAGGAAGDDDEPEKSNTRRRFLPSSIGLTVLLAPDVDELDAHITWGDYRTEPSLPESVLLPEPTFEEPDENGRPEKIDRPLVDWVRTPNAKSYQ